MCSLPSGVWQPIVSESETIGCVYNKRSCPAVKSEGALSTGAIASIHRESEKGYSRKLGFRHPTFSAPQKGASRERRAEPHHRNRTLAFFLCLLSVMRKRCRSPLLRSPRQCSRSEALSRLHTSPNEILRSAPRECVEATISCRPELPCISKSFTLLCTIRFQDPPPYRHETDTRYTRQIRLISKPVFGS
jgi:hypothetical protein